MGLNTAGTILRILKESLEEPGSGWTMSGKSKNFGKYSEIRIMKEKQTIV